MSVTVTPILFLDLDGTVRKGPDELNGRFVHGPGDVEVFDGVLDLLKAYKSKGWKIVSISNQGGIALGHVSDGDVSRAMGETNRLCANLFDGMLWCPHYPTVYNRDKEDTWDNLCMCRKPRIGLVVTAFMNVQRQGLYTYPRACLFVGDRDEDLECSENANIPFMLASDWRKIKPSEV